MIFVLLKILLTYFENIYIYIYIYILQLQLKNSTLRLKNNLKPINLSITDIDKFETNKENIYKNHLV